MAKQSIGVEADLIQQLFQEEDGPRRVLGALCQALMQQEVSQQIQAERHERSPDRRGHRNGYKRRKLSTRVGELELAVPQVRGSEPYHPSLFARWQRSERASGNPLAGRACGEMYFQGVSTRKVTAVLEAMCGGEISSMTVSRVAQELDEKLSVFRARRLDEHEYVYLKVDARYEKVRVDGRIVSQAVLVVMGYTEQGKREILDWRVGDSESEACWGKLFGDLKDRGLRGVKLLVSDAHRGIVSAMQRHFAGVQWQRCQVHFKRELLRRVSYRQSAELMKQVLSVFRAEDAAECLRRGEELAKAWESRNPAVSKMLREGLEDCLTVLSFPSDHRRRLCSTNMLENLMKRLKKRTRVVGVFPSRSSCDRLIGALLMEVHEQWLTEPIATFNMEMTGMN